MDELESAAYVAVRRINNFYQWVSHENAGGDHEKSENKFNFG